MRKPTKCGIFAALMFLAFVAGAFAALIDSRKAAHKEPPHPPHVVFKDYSPKPPKTVDTTPPLSAEECIAALNASYEQMWAEEQAKSNRKESLQ